MPAAAQQTLASFPRRLRWMGEEFDLASEAGVFDGCPDDGTSGVRARGAGNYIDGVGAHDGAKGKHGRQRDREHLALFRCDLQA